MTLMSITPLLKLMVEQNASDLHISSGSAPRIRVQGKLFPLEMPALTPSQSQQLCYSTLSAEQKKAFENQGELDYAFSLENIGRFRGNIFTQRGTHSAAFRIIPQQIPTFTSLGLPGILEEVCLYPRGLLLITGPTGSGKSTSLAAMIDYINQMTQQHIVTIEDPIEYLHNNKNCLINQREVGSDTKNFACALKSCLRQDPDVILVGELRDQETIQLALTAAETGHLVLSSLHTNSSISSINRIIDVFPSDQQNQIRMQLSFNLIGVFSQLLVNTKSDSRMAAVEVMLCNNAIKNLIRENKVHQIYSTMQIGQENSKMQTMNQVLLDLVMQGFISGETALGKAQDLVEFLNLIEKTPGAQRWFRGLI